jgi:signal transduction histidine kinase
MLKKLRTKWILIFLAVILPVILMAAYSFLKLKSSMTNYIYQEKTSVANLTSNIIKERFDRAQDIGVSVASRSQFSQQVCQRNWAEAIEVLKDVPKSFPFINRIFVTDTAGVLRSDLPEAVPSVRGIDFSYRDWYRGVSNKWTPYISEVYRRKATPSYNVVSITTPIESNTASYSICGIVVLQIRLDTLLKWSYEIDVGSASFISIIDHKGQVAASSQYQPQEDIVDYSSVPVVQKVLEGENGIGSFYNPTENEQYLIAYQPVQEYGWAVLLQQPLELAFSEMNKSLDFILVFYAIILLLVILSVYLILRNMMEKMQAEAATKQKAWELEQTNKELEQFVYAASHDLQEPLRTISNYSGLIKEKYSGKSEEDDRHLKYILNATSKMQNLITDLLDLSRVGRDHNRSMVDCCSILNEITDEMEASIRENNVKIVSNSLPAVKGSEIGLKQLFRNLISNAIKFRRENVSPKIEITCEEKEDEYFFAFKDNGIGIDASSKDDIFNVFKRLHTDAEYPGTGIGLATCKKVVSMHKGEIWVESTLDEGSTFYFTIPKD